MTPDDRFHWLSAVGTDVLFAAHVLRVGRSGAQRSLLYVRTDSRVNSEIANPEPDIGMPVPYTSG
ncbi:hypothetical protein GCM10010103_21070 [Streptomyces paradoxus]